MNCVNRRVVTQSAIAVAAATTLRTPFVSVQRGRQTLRFVAESDLRILDPIWTTAYVTRNHGYLVYDTLFGTDESFQIKPQMVERTKVSPDGLSACGGTYVQIAKGSLAVPPRATRHLRQPARDHAKHWNRRS